ncbi:hypothetical protein JTB14_029717 [Gonioctena quinquepunctata]|nr:hypothetical protein JTB14_029717 [Gonioctena quinquepunctata]
MSKLYLIITNINAPYPGATHGSAIWHVSRIHRHMRRKCHRKERVLHYSHLMASRIICSCAVLHNICRKHNLPDEIGDENVDDPVDDHIPDDVNHAEIINNGDDINGGQFIRRQVMTQIQEMVQ